MKDPRHTLDTHSWCTRCGLGSRFGMFCPIGFWADKRQNAIIDAHPERLREFERQWRDEWVVDHEDASPQPSDGQEKRE